MVWCVAFGLNKNFQSAPQKRKTRGKSSPTGGQPRRQEIPLLVFFCCVDKRRLLSKKRFCEKVFDPQTLRQDDKVHVLFFIFSSRCFRKSKSIFFESLEVPKTNHATTIQIPLGEQPALDLLNVNIIFKGSQHRFLPHFPGVFALFVIFCEEHHKKTLENPRINQEKPRKTH